jgi:hypothetical protein
MQKPAPLVGAPGAAGGLPRSPEPILIDGLASEIAAPIPRAIQARKLGLRRYSSRRLRER